MMSCMIVITYFLSCNYYYYYYFFLINTGAIGETTTVELSIFNDRIKTQKIAAKAVQMRYDILASHDAVAKATPSLTPVCMFIYTIMLT